MDINKKEIACLLFPKFKCVRDKSGYEFVVFQQSNVSNGFDMNMFCDKTSFEAFENHIHIPDSINKAGLYVLESVSRKLCKYYVKLLAEQFPDKSFAVCVSLKENEAMIFRFHQCHEDEPLYLQEGKWEDGSVVITELSDQAEN